MVDPQPLAATIKTILRLAIVLNYKDLTRAASTLSCSQPPDTLSAVGVDREGHPLICADSVICRLEPLHHERYPSEHSMFDTLTTVAEMISTLDHPRAIKVMNLNLGLLGGKSRRFINKVNAEGLNCMFDTDHAALLAVVQKKVEQRQRKVWQKQAKRTGHSQKNRAVSSKVQHASKNKAYATSSKPSNPFWLDPEKQNWH